MHCDEAELKEELFFNCNNKEYREFQRSRRQENVSSVLKENTCRILVQQHDQRPRSAVNNIFLFQSKVTQTSDKDLVSNEIFEVNLILPL